jgi:alpha-amylase
VERGQVELLTGGYYEPILPAIPDADRLGQIAKLSATVQEDFGYSPNGLWLAERVWEPQLTQTLAKGGITWTVVDDTHFKLVGLRDEDLFGYYITEEQGNMLRVFATSNRLRYLIPWCEVEEVVGFLRDQATEGGSRIAVMGDDGEKFGSWPGTHKLCWLDGWMDTFFAALEENDSWLKTIPLGEYVGSFPALGRIYLPCASYDEMLEWALPTSKSYEFSKLLRELEAKGRQDIVQYMHGGFWRYFLVKYPEINTMHKKMLRVHEKVYRARAISQAGCGLDDLWRGQCNCPYWHGVFGGVYMTDIRAATYTHLIQAENKADSVLHSGGWLGYERADFDCDGLEEVLIEGDAITLSIDPARGGSIFEWDLRRQNYNLSNVLTRRPEVYHQVLIQSKGKKEAQDSHEVRTIHSGIRIKERRLHRHLHYDRYRRVCLLDHFLDADATLRKFACCSYRELGDFVDQPYECAVDETNNGLRILLRRNGSLRYNRRMLPFRVQKELSLSSGRDELGVEYTLTNISNATIDSVFGTEWNINLLGGSHNDQAYYEVPGVKLDDWHLDSTGELFGIQELALGNKYLGIEILLKLTQRVRLWRFPVESICNSESGLEMVYQGSCILVILPFSLPPGESLRLGLNWLTQ